MTISAAMYSWLTTALAATAVGDRIYPRNGSPPAPAMPFCRWFKVSGQREAKVSRGAGDHASGRFQVNVYSETQIEAESIATAINTAVRNGTRIAPITAIDMDGPYDLPVEIEGQISQTAAVGLDLTVLYKET